MNSTPPFLPGCSRREFLKRAGASLAACAIASPNVLPAATPTPGDGVKPVVGTQLYGWGQYYQREGRDMNQHLDEVLGAVRDCGFSYAEGFLDAENPEANGQFADKLRARGLQPVSLYTGGRLHDEKATATVKRLIAAAKVCQPAGFTVISCNADPIGREKTDAELATQVAALKDLGAALKEMGLRLGVHHHTPEMANQAREFHENFRKSQPGVVDFCFDVHWVYRGGLAPMTALREYGDRVVTWHLRQSRDQVWFEELAAGDIDFGAIAKAAKERGCAPRYSVELALEGGTKVTRSAVENHQRSREFVRQVFGC